MFRTSGTTGKSRDCDEAAKTVQTNYKKGNAELGSAFFCTSANLVKKRVGTKYQPVFNSLEHRKIPQFYWGKQSASAKIKPASEPQAEKY